MGTHRYHQRSKLLYLNAHLPRQPQQRVLLIDKANNVLERCRQRSEDSRRHVTSLNIMMHVISRTAV